MTKIFHTATCDGGHLAECYTDPRFPDDDSQPTEREAEGFRRLVRWLYCERTHNIEGLASRLIAAAYVFDQGLIEHAKLRQIERQTNGRVNRSRVCQLAKEFRLTFHLPPPPPA